MDLSMALDFFKAVDNVSWGEKLSLLVTLWFMLKRIEANLKNAMDAKITEAIHRHKIDHHGLMEKSVKG